uniref:6-pyruvoyltetrahydropterin synthase n=1 Tax=Lotharella globosa TaxID=91324 RepID=A0A7S3Z959_9EUKA|eukprot:CAMPEP_0167780270 /NCGR_PEP_ID=MMETSP0111_2-20121227/5261_1 /TAXON_ID=91324 /ORGANISM="Lotharella globosa, Strain CCCM811" /LENGTH=440 /DNA_ID=CAMNT_0007670757 /DNA_START=75 /DNA_END=1397 /DNA_ORIENTATION=-
MGSLSGGVRINIDKEAIKFSAGHFTIFSAQSRERLHGHNFAVSASFVGTPNEDGMMGDYGVMKSILREVTTALDEYMLIPRNSPYLTIEETPGEVMVIFAGDPPGTRMVFPEGDVKILDVANITVEELSRHLNETVNAKYGPTLSGMGVCSYEISVSSGPGQSAATQTTLTTASTEEGDEGKREPQGTDVFVRGAGGEAKAVSVAVVTGGSSGIGLETARRFKDMGAKVFNISRSPCPLDDVTSLPCDLSDFKSIPSLAEELRSLISEHVSGSEGGGALSLIHNAALYFSDNAGDVDPEMMDRALRVQTVAPALLNRELRPLMTKGSSIIFVGSTLSEKAVSGALTYSTSKHALAGLMRATTQDLFGSGIHCVMVCPGFTDTPMLRKHLSDPEVLSAIASNNSFQRLVEPSEIASVITDASLSPVLNGAIVHANLGQKET